MGDGVGNTSYDQVELQTLDRFKQQANRSIRQNASSSVAALATNLPDYNYAFFAGVSLHIPVAINLIIATKVMPRLALWPLWQRSFLHW